MGTEDLSAATGAKYSALVRIMWWNKEADWRDAWDYKFRWTQHHLTKEQFDPLAYSYDELATKCLDILDELAPPQRPGGVNETQSTFPRNRHHQTLQLLHVAAQEPRPRHLIVEITILFSEPIITLTQP